MAIGDPYATLADLKLALGSSFNGVSSEDAFLNMCLGAASSAIEEHCDRQFNLAPTESPQIFRPGPDPRYVDVDDFVQSTGFVLKTDASGTGTFSTTWTSFDYELLPLGNVKRGRYRPFNEIHAVGGLWFPRIQFRRVATIQVTAQWGWASVPNQVHQACIMLATELYKRKDAPFGVAGFNQFGVVKLKQNPIVCALLATLVVSPIQVA